MADARRRLSGRSAARDAGEGDAQRARPHRRGPTLACSDHLKEIVYRCIGERRKRYESADEMIDALRKPPPALHVGRPAKPRGRAPRVHRHSQQAAARRRPGRQARRRRSSTARRPPERPSSSAAAQPAAGGRAGRRPEADGDQAAAREGAQDHAAERNPVLAPGRKA